MNLTLSQLNYLYVTVMFVIWAQQKTNNECWQQCIRLDKLIQNEDSRGQANPD